MSTRLVDKAKLAQTNSQANNLLCLRVIYFALERPSIKMPDCIFAVVGPLSGQLDLAEMARESTFRRVSFPFHSFQFEKPNFPLPNAQMPTVKHNTQQAPNSTNLFKALVDFLCLTNTLIFSIWLLLLFIACSALLNCCWLHTAGKGTKTKIRNTKTASCKKTFNMYLKIHKMLNSVFVFNIIPCTANEPLLTTDWQLRQPTTGSVSRRPVLSVRRRIINSPTSAAVETTTQQPAAEPPTTSKYSRLRSRPSATATAAAAAATTTTAAATTAFPAATSAPGGRTTSNIYLSKLKAKSGAAAAAAASGEAATLTPATSNISSSSNDITQKQHKFQPASFALRRQFQTRRLTTFAPAANGDESGK